MIKAIIFDCFGVLTTEGWQAFKKQYFADRPRELEQASDINRQLDKGFIGYKEAIAEIAELAGVTIDQVDSVLSNTIVDKEIIEYIRADLKPRYKIGMLSNVRKTWVEEVFEPEDLQLFNDVCLSNEMAITKPDPRAYMIAAKGLLIDPNEAIFIDDLITNVEAARGVGMLAIKYDNFEQFKDDLEELLAGNSKN